MEKHQHGTDGECARDGLKTPALESNLARDTPLDLRILGEAAQLHGGHLPVPAPSHKSASVHQTNDGDTWIQLAVPQETGMSMEDVAFAAYEDLFSEIGRQKGKLVRIWNQIPNILAKENGVIRYHRFNAGRLKAWERFGQKSQTGQIQFPASTGIGSAGPFLFIRALCSQNPLILLQNPQQIPPDKYSAKYGALPPAFSRAAIVLRPDRHQVFVSGTASIIGEDTRHLGAPAAQAQETFNNLGKLIAHDNFQHHGYDGTFTFADLKSMRVYVKFAEQFEGIRAVVEKHARCPTTYKLCDICRDGLLLEIECIFERRPG